MAKQQKPLSCRGCYEMAVATKTGLDSVAVEVFVCSDSNYNQTATTLKRRTKNTTAHNARLIDDEHRSFSII